MLFTGVSVLKTELYTLHLTFKTPHCSLQRSNKSEVTLLWVVKKIHLLIQMHEF